MPSVEPADFPTDRGVRRILQETAIEEASQSSQEIFAAGGRNWRNSVVYCLIAAGAFHLAWTFPALNALALVYAWSLIRLAEDSSKPNSFRFGFLAGFLVFAPQLAWFWNIFGIVSLCLWAVLSFFIGIFVLLLNVWMQQMRGKFLWFAAPVIWCGLEYLRSELYLLKFSWFSVGYLFSGSSGVLPLGVVGVYGVGILLFLCAALFSERRLRDKVALLGAVMLLANLPGANIAEHGEKSVKVAGVQLEFPPDLEVPAHLDRVLKSHPGAQIVVLSEYAFDGPVPRRVREWCRQNNRYLVAGGKEDVVENGVRTFRNTAFVIGPTGEVVFQQGKSVPIQFFNDGLPAREQRVWNSPWGKIAIPICYDLSYRRVTDRFVRAGAQAFIVPFMDVADWGEQQHRQHARVAPVRAREYGLEIFRLGSSGISQLVDEGGRLLAEAPFPGEGEVIGGLLQFQPGRLPLDHWMAPVCSVATLFLVAAFFAAAIAKAQRR